MQCLERNISKNVVLDCNDLSIEIKHYSRLWLAVYSLLKVFFEPEYSQVRDIVKINGTIAKLIDQCIISERSEYSKKTFELRCKITKQGVVETNISIINGEAAEPLHPANFHSFKKMMNNSKNVFNEFNLVLKRFEFYINFNSFALTSS